MKLVLYESDAAKVGLEQMLDEVKPRYRAERCTHYETAHDSEILYALITHILFDIAIEITSPTITTKIRVRGLSGYERLVTRAGKSSFIVLIERREENRDTHLTDAGLYSV